MQIRRSMIDENKSVLFLVFSGKAPTERWGVVEMGGVWL